MLTPVQTKTKSSANGGMTNVSEWRTSAEHTDSSRSAHGQHTVNEGVAAPYNEEDLMRAVRSGDDDQLGLLLKCVDPTVEVLCLAVALDCAARIVPLLLLHDASLVRQKCSGGSTALHIAVQQDSCCEFLK